MGDSPLPWGVRRRLRPASRLSGRRAAPRGRGRLLCLPWAPPARSEMGPQVPTWSGDQPKILLDEESVPRSPLGHTVGFLGVALMLSVVPCRRTGTPTRRSCGCGRRGRSSCRRSAASSSRRSRDGRYRLQRPGEMTPCPRGAEGTLGTALIPPCFLPGSCQRAEKDEASLRSMEKQVRPGKSLEVTSALRGVLVLGMPPGLCQEPRGLYSCVLADPGAGGAAGGKGWGEGEAGQGGGGSAEPPVLDGGGCGQDTAGSARGWAQGGHLHPAPPE